MKYKITLNNKIYEVVVEKGEAVIEAEYEAMAPSAKTEAQASEKATTMVESKASDTKVVGGGEVIKAPLPGTISGVKVSVGDSVKRGQPLVIIEAMKMENDISAPKDGKITGVYVAKGQSVERGTNLVSIE